MRKFKKLVSILLSVIMVFSLFTIIPFEASAADAVTYLYRYWDAETAQVVTETRTCSNYQSLSSLSGSEEQYLWGQDTTLGTMFPNNYSGWYVAYGMVMFTKTVTIQGTVNLIVCDGMPAVFSDGIRVSEGSTLNIYGQSDTSILSAYADTNDCAAIGGGDGYNCGTINIYSGIVSADTITDGTDAAGIGGGDEGNGGNITIYGGSVTAKGGSCGAGIGGGDADGVGGNGGNITIYGGTITAEGGDYGAGIGGGQGGNGGNITINGGTVTAYGGEDAAGVGGGEDGDGGSITINGGKIYAVGKTYGAGVGGGENGSGGSITVTDCEKLRAAGGSNNSNNTSTRNGGAGIGCGRNGENATINITGGSEIEAIGGLYNPGIGGISCTVTISGGDITAEGGKKGAGIGGTINNSGGTITIDGGTIEATGGDFAAGIGGGSDTGSSGTIVINDGDITAEGGFGGAGIGSGTAHQSGNGTISVTINGGTVTATGGKSVYDDEEGEDDDDWVVPAPGIGAGSSRTYINEYGGYSHFNGSVTFNGGTVTAQAGAINRQKINHASYSDNIDTIKNRAIAIGGNEFESGCCEGTVTFNGGVVIAQTSAYDGQYYSQPIRAKSISFNEDPPLMVSKLSPVTYAPKASMTAFCTTASSGVRIEPCDHDAAHASIGEITDTTHAKVCDCCGRSMTEAHDFDVTWTWDDATYSASCVLECNQCGHTPVLPEVEMTTDILEPYCVSNGSMKRTASLVYQGNTYQDQKTYAMLPRGSHNYGEPEWAWSDDFEATLTLTCDDCGAQNSAYARVSSEAFDDKTVYTATALLNGTTYTDTKTQYHEFPQIEPTIDENGAYILGVMEHFEIDGKNYAVNEDGSVGEELASIELSYFEFELLENDTYRINHYTGSNQITELVIPKTFNGKAVTQLGTGGYCDKFITADDVSQYKLVLNENITTINGFAFWTKQVTEVCGDTSSLNTIDRYAFSWANSIGDYSLDIQLDYPGQISCGFDIFNDMKNVTIRLKHATTLSRTSFGQQNLNYVFTDDHTYGRPTWTWSDDNSAATATFTCTDSRCNHQETVDATVTRSGAANGKVLLKASAQLNGNTYTDTKSVDRDGYFVGHSLSLNGDIGINFYVNLTDDEFASGAAVDFSWTVNGVGKTHSVTLTADNKTDNGYKATCPVAVAEMTYEVTATLSLNGEQVDTDTYSVRQYADVILSDDFRSSYTGTGAKSYENLERLVKTMLDYGAKAQKQFKRNTGNLANSSVDYTMAAVTSDMISTVPSNMESGLDAYGLEYAGTTIVYLSKTSLRHYYTITDQDKFDLVKNSITFGGATVGYTEKNGMIYFEYKNIAAADLDTPYTLTIGSSSYDYSVLDYVRECLNADDVPHNTLMLVSATYWYNQAANAYFGR